ncbi:hypothetical protein HZA86_05485 [Candidatus Uhrbacteria bacterium]|nr:hypothetical protein [Candidatus Uhrbacteria bacterium]
MAYSPCRLIYATTTAVGATVTSDGTPSVVDWRIDVLPRRCTSWRFGGQGRQAARLRVSTLRQIEPGQSKGLSGAAWGEAP